MKKMFLIAILFAWQNGLTAAPKLPNIFGEGMILQRDMPITIWGWAEKNEKITVSFHQQTKTTKAGKDGRWLLKLLPETAGGPFILKVDGKTSISFGNILVGDIWLCSGQSNMEWPVKESKDSKKEIAASANDQIRHFTVAKAVSSKPLDDVAAASWKLADPANTGEFTAVGYFFARELQAKLKIPIGLVHSSWGGTDIETWISKDAMANDEEFKSMMAAIPTLNLDSIAANRKAAADKMVKSIQETLPTAEQVQTFTAKNFDDSDWPTMNLPGLWEQQQLKQFDGVVWFRKKLMLTAAAAKANATLYLAKVDDTDETYVNGKKVGGSSGYNQERKYSIPAGLLQEGENLISIRVEDTGGGGGVYGESAALMMECGSEKFSLVGPWAFQIEKTAGSNRSFDPNAYPNLLYNAMIHPIQHFAIKGALWYQGENNAGRAAQYAKAFPLMINDWRKQWNEADFPFYFVQLASFIAEDGNSQKGSSWAELREAQTKTLSLPNTGMAVTTDIGERDDIHPRNKQDVGKRLAAVALRGTYNIDEVAAGPAYAGMEVKGSQVLVDFKQKGSGLVAKDKYGYIRGFEIAGADQQFYFARAWIENGKLLLSSEKVPTPVAVRFAWSDDAGEANLFNLEGFPAEPFRTDNWKSITTSAKYQR